MKLTLSLIVLIISSFFALNQELVRYSCLDNRIDIDGFTKSRKFDSNGIIMNAGKYHPLVISQYGTLAYYRFLDTGDSTYYSKCINQAKYFKDQSKIDTLFNGLGIGLPYNFNFGDLKSPWYSGMTQGYGVSFLLRYYDLTKDHSILSIIKKIGYVLMQPEKKGGTISITPEGYKWIEEYPNSKNSRSVLNGSINGLIGLKEYCDFFNKDTIAKKLFNEIYDGIKNSLTLYDTSNWTYYNRNKKKVSNVYMRYEFHQMLHLFAIFNDNTFDHQMRIWGAMSYNKLLNKDIKMYPYAKTNVSLPSSYTDSAYRMKLPKKLIILDSNFNIEYSKKQKKKRKIKKTIFDFEVYNENQVNYLEIILDSNSHRIFNLQCRDMLNNTISDLDFELFNEKVKIILPSHVSNNIQLIINHKKDIPLIIKKVKAYNTDKFIRKPYISYFKTEQLLLSSDDKYIVKCQTYNTKRQVTFYRYSEVETNLSKQKWMGSQFLLSEFTPEKTGYYEFLTVYDWDNPLSRSNKLILEKIK